MTENLDLGPDAFGPPLVGAGYPEVPGPVPPYEERVKVLMGDAHALLLGIETQMARAVEGMQDLKQIFDDLTQQLPHIRRWLDRHELHICQIDHPDLRDERPLGPPPTIEGEVL